MSAASCKKNKDSNAEEDKPTEALTIGSNALAKEKGSIVTMMAVLSLLL